MAKSESYTINEVIPGNKPGPEKNQMLCNLVTPQGYF